MRKRVKSLLSFLLALVLTAAVVMALSAMTSRLAYTPPSANDEQTGAQELTAAIPEESPALSKSLLGFGAILLVALTGGVLYLNARYKPPKPVKRSRRTRRPQPQMRPVIVKRM